MMFQLVITIILLVLTLFEYVLRQLYQPHKSSAIFPAVYPVICTYMWNRIFICGTMEECGRGVVLYGSDLQR